MHHVLSKICQYDQKHTLFSNFARFCTPKRCTRVHCPVLKNNPNYVNFFTRMISNFKYKWPPGWQVVNFSEPVYSCAAFPRWDWVVTLHGSWPLPSGHTPLNGFPILYCSEWHTKLLRFLSYKVSGNFILEFLWRSWSWWTWRGKISRSRTNFFAGVPFTRIRFGHLVIFNWNSSLFLESRA